MYGLIGDRLGHSYSKIIHDQLSDGLYCYELIELKPQALAGFFEKGAFQGLNVTIPYKKAVIPFLSRLTDHARRIGCVNTILSEPDGWIGENTDYAGFWQMVKQAGITLRGKKVLLMGNGGTSLTAKAVMQDEGVRELVQVSRSGELTFEQLFREKRHQDAQVIINTTPVGMNPNNGEVLIDLQDFPQCEGVVDVIYNPRRTALLLQAETLGIPYTDGLTMLVAQAKAASDLFLKRVTPDSRIDDVVRTIKNRTLNLVIVGMPGSGKSTVGHALARRLKRNFVDLDAEIEKRSGMSIPQIFAEQGEQAFRDLEQQVAQDYGKENGLVIATGGGVVLREINRNSLRQNGIVVWLQRSVERLPIEGRPLSVSRENLNQMAVVREPFYRACADFMVQNDGSAAETVDQILTQWETAG